MEKDTFSCLNDYLLIKWKQKYRLYGIFYLKQDEKQKEVLGDSFGSLGDGMLGELTREEEPDSSLHFTGGDSGPLVVVSKTAGLSSDGSKRTDFIALANFVILKVERSTLKFCTKF